MAKILEMPKLSPTMEEGVLSTWHKKEGDAIAVDDLLAEVETDKATMEFRAFDKGTLLKLLVAPGALVKLGQPVAVLGSPGEDISSLGVGENAAAAAEAPKAALPTPMGQGAPPAPPRAMAPAGGDTLPPPAVRPAAAIPPAVPPTMAPPAAATPPPAPARNLLDRTDHEPARADRARAGATEDQQERNRERVLASPYVRKAARDLGIDLHGAQGSGPGGRLVIGDLEGLKAPRDGGANATALAKASTLAAPLAQQQAPRSGLSLAEPEVRPLSMMRKTIARRLTESKQTVPHFYLTIDVDAEGLAGLRERINAELADGSPGHTTGSGSNGKGDGTSAAPPKVSINDLLIKACAAALVRVPECNAQFSPDAILVHRRVDISVAVAIAEGLVTPVVRDADKKSVVAIAREVRELAGRARAKKLTPDEMTGGTFSISNLGMFGIDSFCAVINPPEGAILAVGQVRDTPVVRDGAVVPGKRLAMTLSCDHRVVDGAVGAAFLAELRALIEHPMRILTG